MIPPLAALLRLHELRAAIGQEHAVPSPVASSEEGRLLQALSPTLDARYRKLARRHGLSAIVPMYRGVCSGCHMRQPSCAPVIDTDIYECQHCGRLLYDPDVAYEYSVG